MKSKLESQKEKLEDQVKKIKSQIKELNKKIEEETIKEREEKLITSGKLLEQFKIINLDQPLDLMEKNLADFLAETEWNTRETSASFDEPGEIFEDKNLK